MWGFEREDKSRGSFSLSRAGSKGSGRGRASEGTAGPVHASSSAGRAPRLPHPRRGAGGQFKPSEVPEPHLLLRLKWEYFAPFSFFHLDLVFRCLRCRLGPDANEEGRESVTRERLARMPWRGHGGRGQKAGSCLSSGPGAAASRARSRGSPRAGGARRSGRRDGRATGAPSSPPGRAPAREAGAALSRPVGVCASLASRPRAKLRLSHVRM